MSKFYYLLLFIFITTCITKAGDFPYKYERISVNFNGVAAKGNTVLAYGDGSIVLRSPDKGVNWSQIQIAADEYEIKKIDYVFNQFFGILNSEYIVFSEDDGKTWSKKKIADSLSMYDFAVFNNHIYILTTNSIIVINSEFGITNTIPIDTSLKAVNFSIINNLAVLPADSAKLYFVDLSSGNNQRIFDFGKNLLCVNCGKPEQIISDNDSLYSRIGSKLFKSTDMGFNWFLLDSSAGLVKLYNGSIYSISSKKAGNYLLSDLYFCKLEANGLSRLNSNEITRYVPTQTYNGFTFLNDNEIIAVGKYKLIGKSSDGGYRWEFISSFDNSSASYGFWVDENLGYYCLGEELVAKTTNGGTTWLPQLFTNEKSNRVKFGHARFFDRDGFGLIYFDKKVQGDINVSYTKDYGEHYSAINFNDIIGLVRENNLIVLKKEDNILIIFPGRFRENHYTIFYTLNKDFSILNKTVVDSMTVLHARTDESTGNIITIARERKSSSGNEQFNIDKYCLMTYDDKGIELSRQFSFNLKKELKLVNYIDSTYFMVTTKQDTIVTRYYKSIATLHSQNFKLDDEIKTDTTMSQDSFFKLDNYTNISGYRCLFYNENYNENVFNWLRRETIVYNTAVPQFSNNNICFINFIYGFSNFKIYKLTGIDSTVMSNEETKQPTDTPILIYPNPARDKVNISIDIENGNFNDNSNFAVYDLFGTKICGNDKIRLIEKNSERALYEMDCSIVQSGYYFIKINSGITNKTAPIIIMK